MCTRTSLTSWQQMCDRMPPNIFVFPTKTLIFSLSNNTNLFRWKRSPSELCGLCNKKQTQLDVLNNCSVSENSGRYLWRHNSVLYTMYHYISQLVSRGYEVFVDLEGYQNPSELFRNVRPDLVLKRNGKLISIELTCCFETNLAKSREYKIQKYQSIENDCYETNVSVEKLFVEVTSLGFTPRVIRTFYETDEKSQHKLYENDR